MSVDENSNSLKEDIQTVVPVEEETDDKREQNFFSVFKASKFNDYCDVNVFVNKLK